MARPPRVNSSWPINFDVAQVDRRTRRSSVGTNILSDAVGVDGNYEGGLRPHTGFRRDLSFDPNVINSGSMSAEPRISTTDSNHDHESKILDFFPVAAAQGTNNYLFGHIYRVRRSGSTTISDVFAYVWDSKYSKWWSQRVITDVEDSAGSYDTEDSVEEVNTTIDSPMSVVVFGRFIYISIQGRPMTLVYYNTPTNGLTVVGNPADDYLVGPGAQPLCEGPQEHPDGTTFGLLVEPTDPHETAHARVWVPASLPEDLSSPFASQGAQTDPGEPQILEAGDYSFAFFLMDSTSGRRTGLSTIGTVLEADFSAANKYCVMSIAYKSSQFDQMWVYRSVRTQDAGGAYAGRILQLDAIVDLADYHSEYNTSGGTTVDSVAAQYDTDTAGGWRHSLYYYHRSDKDLGWQETYADYPFFETTAPKAGSSAMYNGALLLSQITGNNILATEETQPDTEKRNISELRWSSLIASSPELFSPSDRQSTGNPANTIIAFGSAGSNVIGFSRDRQYHIRTEGTVIKVQEMHVGYGIAGPYCHATVGNRVYFLSDRGLKSTSSNGQLDDVRSINMDVMVRWKGTLNTCSMAHDAAIGALFILNPTLKEMITIWFNSGLVTRDLDIPFSQVKAGPWPSGYTSSNLVSASSQLIDRAQFIQNYPDEDYGSIPATWTPNLYTYDHERTKIDSDDNTRITLLDYKGAMRATVSDTAQATGKLFFEEDIATENDRPYLPGSYIYCISVPAGSSTSIQNLVGKKTMILDRNSADTKSVLLSDDVLLTMPPGSRCTVSPVPFEIISSRIVPTSENGQQFSRSMAHASQIESGDLIFTRISGAPTTDETTDHIVFGAVYSGDQDLPESTGVSTTVIREGAIELGISFSSSQSGRKGGVKGINLAVGAKVLCSDLDFVLLGITLYGTMTSETRNE